MAGRRGLGALAFQFLSADAAHAWVHAYYNAFTKRQQKLADYVTNPNLAITSYFMCAETDEEARRRADGIPFFQFALRFYGQQANRRRPDPGTVNLWDEYEKWKRANPENHARALRGGLIGSPETLREKLRKFETSHIDSVILLNQAGKNTHEHICESLELFAREVMPEFHARIPEQEEWKAKVLAREIELEEIDTQPFRDRYGPNSVQLRQAIGPQGGGVAANARHPARPLPRRRAGTAADHARCREGGRAARLFGHLRAEHLRQHGAMHGAGAGHRAHPVRHRDRADLCPHGRGFRAQRRLYPRNLGRPVPLRDRRRARARAISAWA